LILQPVALFLLPALRNSILLVANNSLQLTNEITVSSGSASIVTAVSTHRLPLVHAQDGASKQGSDDLIALPAAVLQHEREGCVSFIVFEFQQLLAYRRLGRSLCRSKSTQQHRA
jgi:hypothetical protein